jgi:hypothetical protein
MMKIANITSTKSNTSVAVAVETVFDRTTRSLPYKPWRISKKQVMSQKKDAVAVLNSSNTVNSSAIVFCYEAGELLDKVPEASELYIAARNSVDHYRQVATNDSDPADIQCAHAEALLALEIVGLKEQLHCALTMSHPGKWPKMHEIIKGLWCGGLVALNDDCRELREKNVSCVVSVVSAEKRKLPIDLVKEHLHIQVYDSDDAQLLDHFPAIATFIEGALALNRVVFVHCGAGISRAPTAVTSFIMWRYGLPARDALNLVKRARPCTRPNTNFVRQLVEWEKRDVGSKEVAGEYLTSGREINAADVKNDTSRSCDEDSSDGNSITENRSSIFAGGQSSPNIKNKLS